MPQEILQVRQLRSPQAQSIARLFAEQAFLPLSLPPLNFVRYEHHNQNGISPSSSKLSKLLFAAGAGFSFGSELSCDEVDDLPPII